VHERHTSLMSLQLDGVATPKEQLELTRHLDACPACAATWEQWQAIDRLLSTSPSVAPSLDLAQGLPLALHQRERSRPGWGWLTLGLLVVWILGLAGSCLAILCLSWWGLRHPLEVAVVLASGAQVLSEVNLLLGALETVIAGMGRLVLVGMLAICTTGAGGLVVLWIWVVIRTGIAPDSATVTMPAETGTP
jgi:anti-sigma factor RsiW